MKVFLGTNVLASALATRGLCAELFESVLTGHELLASREFLAELRRILTAKLRIPADTADAFLTLIDANATSLTTPAEFPARIPDPDDAPLIATARAGGAECFVAGDKALLDLARSPACRCSRPGDSGNCRDTDDKACPMGPSKQGRETKSEISLTPLALWESLLAFGRDDDYRQTCERSKQCARPEDIFNKGIVLTSDSYNLLPMNQDATQIDWSHRTARAMPMGGELIFFKGLPYLMTGVSWSQNLHDDFANSRMRADDPYSAIFTLDMVTYGSTNPQSKDFRDVTNVSPAINDPEDNTVCRIGYFHRDNLKQNSLKRAR